MSSKEMVIELLTQPQVSDMLNIVRTRKRVPTSVEELREIMGISRSTADKLFNALSGKELGSPALVYRENGITKVSGKSAFFLGISIGSKYIRVVLLDLNFNLVDLKEYIGSVFEDIPGYCSEIPSEESYTFDLSRGDSIEKFERIRTIVGGVVETIIKRVKEVSDFPLLGIGFAVTGPVDYKERIWRSSPRISNLLDLTIADLIGYTNKKRIDEMGIFLSLDNNSKAAIISEYEYLLEATNGEYNENLALVYVGTGVGLAAIIDGRLLRSSSNMSGELGHAQIMFRQEKQELADVSTKTVEELLSENENNLSLFMPYVLNIVYCTLGTNRFVLVGHNVLKTDLLKNKIMDQRMKFTLPSTRNTSLIEEGRGVPYTAAIGAAMEAYYTLCNYNPQGNARLRTNLAYDISWKMED